MLLAVDIGNTQTVIGLFSGNELVTHWRLATNASSTADELHIKLHALLELDGFRLQNTAALCLASVVPELTITWQRLASMLSIELLIVGPKTVQFLPIRYAHPSEVGADRLADAVAAVDAYGAPVIVVDLGTATNIEVIDRSGSFCGGIIAPGLMTSANALFKAAARLSNVDLIQPEQPIGINTRTAVQSGLVYGEIDRIDGLVRRVFDQLGYEAPVIATGGIAHRLAPLSSTITHLDETLTLKGLRLIFERHSKEASSEDPL